MAPYDPTRSLLDRSAWIDPAVLELERRRLFATAWLCLGPLNRLARPGQSVATWMGPLPVLVLRRNQAVDAVVDRCPFCDGPLSPVSSTGDWSVGCARHGPIEQAVEHVPSLSVRGGLLFASLDPEPLPLTDWLGPFAPWFDRAVEPGVDAEGSVPLTWSFDGNWKLAADRFCSAPEGARTVAAGPGVCHLSGDAIVALALFPSLCLDPPRNSLHLWHPQSTVRTQVETTCIVTPHATAGERQGARRAAMLAWGPYGCESQPLAAAWESITATATGPLARRTLLPMLDDETGPRAFHAWWARELEAKNERPAAPDRLRLAS